MLIISNSPFSEKEEELWHVKPYICIKVPAVESKNANFWINFELLDSSRESLFHKVKLDRQNIKQNKMRKQIKTELEMRNAQITMHHSRAHANVLIKELIEERCKWPMLQPPE